MPRTKKIPLSPWLSAAADCSDKRFLRVGNSLLLSKPFQALSSAAKVAYLSMGMEASVCREFEFPRAAAEKYGIERKALYRAVDELEQAGFIEVVLNGQAYKKPSRYRFSFRWKRPDGC